MRKVIFFVKRRSDTPRDAFFAWLLEEHRRLAIGIPGLRRYTISLEANEEDGVFDALLELTFDDMHSVERAFADAAAKATLDGIDAHVSRVERVDLVEHRFVDAGRPAAFKLIAALKRRDDMTRVEFKSWWLDRHAPLVVVFPELGRYQVDIVEDGPEQFVDGIAEVSFADLATLKRITSSAQVKNVQEDSQRHTSSRNRLYVEEHTIAL
jgi:EthD domain